MYRYRTAQDCTESTLEAADRAIIVSALDEASPGWLRDVDAACDPEAVPAEATVEVTGGEFFRHTYIDNYNVYDFSAWAADGGHPGGKEQITMWAHGDFAIPFQANHPMSRWTQGATQSKLHLLGRLGDSVDFTALPATLQNQRVANAFSVSENAGYFEACGSPGEVGGDAAKGHLFKFFTLFSSDDPVDRERKFNGGATDDFVDPTAQDAAKVTVWLRMAMEAPDQLRQRMAWALAQPSVFT